MSGLSADHRRIFAGFDAKVATRWPCSRFFSIGTSTLVVHLEIGGLGSNGIFCPLVMCKECQSIGWDVETTLLCRGKAYCRC